MEGDQYDGPWDQRVRCVPDTTVFHERGTEGNERDREGDGAED